MNDDVPSRTEDQFAGLLAEWDQALATGAALPSSPPGAVPAEVQQRAARSLPSLLLLRNLWPRRLSTAGSTFTAPLTHLGPFRIRGELGRGGFGVVFLAEDERLGRDVALKVPRPESLLNPDLRERFVREAKASAMLDHPNLVPVYEAGEMGGVCYIASAYCSGGNLAHWLKEHPEPIAPRAAALLIASLADGVQHAHSRGILHRDLKPSNILLVPGRMTSGVCKEAGAYASEALDFIAKVGDFGLAKLQEGETEDTSTGMIVGTAAYMSPEQAEGWVTGIGAPTDVYALGVILYEVLTRQLPCRGPSLVMTLEQVRSGQPPPPSQLRSDVPRDLETVCLKCLQKEPSDRYATAGALGEDLRRFLANETIQARPVGLVGKLWRWCRRSERIRDAATIAGLIVLLSVSVTTCGIILLAAGVIAVSVPLPALGFFLFTYVVVSLPMIWITAGTRARRLTPLWGGLLVPLLFAFGYLATWMRVVDTGEFMAGMRSLDLAQMITLMFLFGIQFCSHVLALIAYYANRHIPGFVPEHQLNSETTNC